MRNYHVEFKDLRDDTIINVDNVKADLFVVDDEHVTVTFFVENSNSSMIPVAMYPFIFINSINSEPTEEGDSE